jgi:hypothetical protein
MLLIELPQDIQSRFNTSAEWTWIFLLQLPEGLRWLRFRAPALDCYLRWLFPRPDTGSPEGHSWQSSSRAMKGGGWGRSHFSRCKLELLTGVFSFGRNPSRLAPGLNLRLPIYHSIQLVDLRESSISIPNVRRWRRFWNGHLNNYLMIKATRLYIR